MCTTSTNGVNPLPSQEVQLPVQQQIPEPPLSEQGQQLSHKPTATLDQQQQNRSSAVQDSPGQSAQLPVQQQVRQPELSEQDRLGQRQSEVEPESGQRGGPLPQQQQLQPSNVQQLDAQPAAQLVQEPLNKDTAESQKPVSENKTEARMTGDEEKRQDVNVEKQEPKEPSQQIDQSGGKQTEGDGQSKGGKVMTGTEIRPGERDAKANERGDQPLDDTDDILAADAAKDTDENDDFGPAKNEVFIHRVTFETFQTSKFVIQ